jgi:hypothetical protein
MAEENKSLAAMMSALQILERQIDDANEITPEQCEEHFGSIKEVDIKVDRLLSFMDLCKQNAATYSERAESLQNASKSWERKYDALSKYALWLTDEYPEIEWRGSDRTFGKKLNPPSLNCQAKKSYSTTNHIPDELIFSIPEKYRECKIIWLLKSDLVKDDLKTGKTLNFARLDRKEALAVKPKLKGDKT